MALDEPSAVARDADNAVNDYFGGDTKDSLGDLLRKARESDPSVTDDRPTDETSQSTDSDNQGSDDPELDDQELDKTSDELLSDEDDEESSQAEEDRKARIARQRAMIRHLQKLQKPVHQIQITGAYAPANEVPENRAAFVVGHQMPQTIAGLNAQPDLADRYPVGFSHRPLYFEEIDLERCGQNRGAFQNLCSAKHFLLNTIALPYRICTQSPSDLVSARGDCRTRRSFGQDIEPLVDNGRNRQGLLSQAATMAGFSFLLL